MLAGAAWGIDAIGRYAVLGYGVQSCGWWGQERRANSLDSGTATAWVTGYLTAINHERPNINDIRGGTDLAGIQGWLDNYCAAHPLDDISDAVNALVYELAARQKSS